MHLNGRSSIDPRWAFHHRGVARGAMLGRGVLYRNLAKDPTAVTWDPFATDPADRTPLATSDFEPIYEGPCRVQPNKDWRGRAQGWREQTIVQSATRIQLDFFENDLKDAPINDGVRFPQVAVNDIFRVTEVAQWGEYPVDEQLADFTYIIRNLTPSTNSWVRNLLADNDVTQVSSG